MHVAINAQLVSFPDSYRNAGVSRYTYRLVEALARLDAGQHYTVFVNGSDQQAVTGFGNDRLRLVPSRWPTTQPAQRILWEQTALPELLRRVRAKPRARFPMRLRGRRIPLSVRRRRGGSSSSRCMPASLKNSPICSTDRSHNAPEPP